MNDPSIKYAVHRQSSAASATGSAIAIIAPPMRVASSFAFMRLGHGVAPNAATGSGTGDLLDEVLRLLPEEKAGQDDDRPDLPRS